MVFFLPPLKKHVGEKTLNETEIEDLNNYFICAFLIKPVLDNWGMVFCEEAWAGIRLLVWNEANLLPNPWRLDKGSSRLSRVAAWRWVFCWGAAGWYIARCEYVLRDNRTELGEEVRFRIVLNAGNAASWFCGELGCLCICLLGFHLH